MTFHELALYILYYICGVVRTCYREGMLRGTAFIDNKLPAATNDAFMLQGVVVLG